MINLQNALKVESLAQILGFFQKITDNSDELEFWSSKIMAYSEAVLSILVPLRDQNLLFTPEGEYQNELNIELFLQWMDFVSLKALVFTIEESNLNKKLLRTKLLTKQTNNYKAIDVQTLAKYLASYNVDLSKENLDFPISSYNIHSGVKKIIESLIKNSSN